MQMLTSYPRAGQEYFRQGSGICVLVCSVGNAHSRSGLKSSGIDHAEPQVWEIGAWDDPSSALGSLSVHFQLERLDTLL